MVEDNPSNNSHQDQDDESDVKELEAQLNEIESALDNLESQNDNILAKLKDVLESNREIRKEFASLNKKEDVQESKTLNQKQENADVSQLQKMHELSLNKKAANSKGDLKSEKASSKLKKN
ncbi:hypothetical protein BpHYR1_047864 [Brachionus plicatilis]|uniref:Uncharacterized protein n=1 Tax=Brachionus plicatilis TaxID=10195 RepID=A0A3M7T8N1_BRAPC|nr:hypothetical protein BpHYR1_047864 [Brachionus plicatilis]